MFWLLFFLVALLALGYWRAKLNTCAWLLAGAILFFGLFGNALAATLLLALAWLIVFVPLLVPALRQEWLSRPALRGLRRALEALPTELLPLLESGTTAWEAELFSGAPDWQKLLSLTAKGDATPTDTEAGEPWTDACNFARARADASAELDRRGWLELVRQYGTDAQRKWLTQSGPSPPSIVAGHCGIDPERDVAGTARLAHARYRGEECAGLELRLHPELCARAGADRIGVVVWIDDRRASGTACVLLPVDADGLDPRPLSDGRLAIGGSRVFVPMTEVVGGMAGLGEGARWLSCARARSRAAAALAAAVSGAATLAIGAACRARAHAPQVPPATRRDAIERQLAVLAAELYAGAAMARLAATELGAERAPTVLSAINDRQGQRLGRLAAATPELLAACGALARLQAQTQLPKVAPAAPLLATNLGVRAFGRCHPQLRLELEAVRDDNPARGLEQFDAAFWSHVGALFSHGVRSLICALGGAALVPTAGLPPTAARCLRRIHRGSAALALVADLALLSRRWRLANDDTLLAAVGDVLARLHAASAALWHGQHAASASPQWSLLRLACAQALDGAQLALSRALAQLPRPARWLGRVLIFPWGRWSTPLREGDCEVAATWLWNGGAAGYLSELLPTPVPDPLALLQRLLAATLVAETLAVPGNAEDQAKHREWLRLLQEAGDGATGAAS